MDRTRYVIDKAAFEARGGFGCSSSAYALVRTTCCGRFAVEDEELLDLYFDPDDLTKTVKLYEDGACPFCGSDDWDLEGIDAPAAAPGDWQWAVAK